MIKITKVKIFNFKIYRHQEFDFGESKFVLLTGANGFGKTTLIDAIEWCLSGNINRIKTCYEQRNPSQSEKNREENKKGIVKNKDCKDSDNIRVEITFNIDNKEVGVFREQQYDNILVATNIQFIGQVPEETSTRILQFAEKEWFNNYYICDVYKSYSFLNRGRKEVKDLFEDFTRTHLKADKFSNTLYKFQENIAKEIDDLKSRKGKFDERIEQIESEINLLKKDIKIVSYPKEKFFVDENLEIEQENNAEYIINQSDMIKICGYKILRDKINDFISYSETKERNILLNELLDILKNKENDIRITLDNMFYDSKQLDVLKSNIQKHQENINLINNAKEISDINISYFMENCKEEKIHNQFKELKDLNNLIKEKHDEIKEKEKGNEIIAALSNLLIGRKGFLEYKNEGNILCPLCGSDNFQNLQKAEEFAQEAERYLNISNTNLTLLKEKEQDLINNYNINYNTFKTSIISILTIDLESLKDKSNQFLYYNSHTKEFFEKLVRINIIPNKDCINDVLQYSTEISTKLSNSNIVSSDLELLKNLAIELGFDLNIDNITMENLYKFQLEINQLCDTDLQVSNFSFKVFSHKLLFFNNLLKNQSLNNKSNELKDIKDNSKKINDEILRLDLLRSKGKALRDKIELKKADIEKIELKSVGPYLADIFTKIAKHNNVKEISFNRDRSRSGGGAVLLDESENNLLNIFSQGQLGVFMITYFFANMFKRKDETEFKTYFVDDVTSSLDDMNVLSFIDIIKYQLYKDNGVINQLFFSTCDENLERLFINKMDSFDIKWINFKFNSYAKGIVQSANNELDKFGYDI